MNNVNYDRLHGIKGFYNGSVDHMEEMIMLLDKQQQLHTTCTWLPSLIQTTESIHLHSPSRQEERKRLRDGSCPYLLKA